MTKKEEINCTLSSEELSGRVNGDIATLLSQVEETAELKDGYRWRFAGTGERLKQVTDFIAAERQCCSFLRFDLTVSPDQGPIFLTLGGSPEIKRFIAQMLK